MTGDRGAVHVVVAPPGGGQAGRAALFQVDGTKVANLLPSQFATDIVDGGFDVELGLDWGTLGLVAPPSPGALVAFDFGLDVHTTSAADARTFRVQSFFDLREGATLSDTACTPDYAAPFCDDRLWCTPTLQ